MRLFVALSPPAGVRRQLAERRRRLAGELPSCRWVPEPNLHLTLLFLGDTEPPRVGDLDRELGTAFGAAARFTAQIGEPGCFPPRGAPRVLWLAVGPRALLERLHRRVVDAAVSARGVGGEARRFHPHLTVGRCRGRWPAAARRRFRVGFEAPPTSFPVDEGALVESRLGPSGARYRALARYPLGAAA